MSAIKREPIALPVWRIVMPIHSNNKDESISYEVIAESSVPYTADEIEALEQTQGCDLIQEETFEYF